MHSVILLLPNAQLQHLPGLAQVLGLNDIQFSVSLGPDADTATHSAGHIWHLLSIVRGLGDETLDCSGCGLSVDTVETLIEQAHLKVTEPGTLLPPRMQLQALINEMGLVGATA
tara:strand:- start:476 stop:817 length:342 start_codon:yes stop_codon:yes gene_type:complete